MPEQRHMYWRTRRLQMQLCRRFSRWELINTVYMWCPYSAANFLQDHDDIINWKHFPRYWPFVRGIHRSFPHKGQWRSALMFSLICVWINGWVNNHEAGDLRRYRAHYDVTAMYSQETPHSLRVRARYGVSVVNLKSDLCSAAISTMLCVISW